MMSAYHQVLSPFQRVKKTDTVHPILLHSHLLQKQAIVTLTVKCILENKPIEAPYHEVQLLLPLKVNDSEGVKTIQVNFLPESKRFFAVVVHLYQVQLIALGFDKDVVTL